MSTLQAHLPLIEGFCRSLTRTYPDQDYRDLAQDVAERLLKLPEAKLTPPYIITVCKNTWRDRLGYTALRRMTSLEANPHIVVAFQPAVLCEIEAREMGLNLNEWEATEPVPREQLLARNRAKKSAAKAYANPILRELKKKKMLERYYRKKEGKL